MLTNEQIKQFIEKDKTSTKKRLARVGMNYYEGDHDIKNYRLFYYNADSELKEDKSKSNVKIPHPFFTEIIDQKIQYLFSGDGYFVKSKDTKLQDYLNEYINENEDFKAELEEVATEASSKGFGYLFMKRDEKGHITFQCADTMGVVEVRAKDTQDNCDYVIYWYLDRITEEDEKIYRIQVWTDKEVHYFVQVNDGAIEKDETEAINPRPHSIYTVDGEEGKFGEDFGLIPFFRLDNNRKQISDLKPIKALIDDYDLMACGLSNNIQDASEYLVVVKGFEGNNLEELDHNLRTLKRMGVPEGADVDFKTVDIPYDARKVKLELDEKNIYRFGMAFNSAQLGDGNITNIVIKSRYALLDLKCNKFETQLRKLLRKIVKVILDEINEENETDFQLKDVYFEFEREVMTNALDNAAIEKTKAETQQIQINTLLNLIATIGDETTIKLICDCLDIDYEEIKDKLPTIDDDTSAVKKDLENVVVEDVDGVGVA